MQVGLFLNKAFAIVKEKFVFAPFWDRSAH